MPFRDDDEYTNLDTVRSIDPGYNPKKAFAEDPYQRHEERQKRSSRTTSSSNYREGYADSRRGADRRERRVYDSNRDRPRSPVRSSRSHHTASTARPPKSSHPDHGDRYLDDRSQHSPTVSARSRRAESNVPYFDDVEASQTQSVRHQGSTRGSGGIPNGQAQWREDQNALAYQNSERSNAAWEAQQAEWEMKGYLRQQMEPLLKASDQFIDPFQSISYRGKQVMAREQVIEELLQGTRPRAPSSVPQLPPPASHSRGSARSLATEDDRRMLQAPAPRGFIEDAPFSDNELLGLSRDFQDQALTEHSRRSTRDEPPIARDYERDPLISAFASSRNRDRPPEMRKVSFGDLSLYSPPRNRSPDPSTGNQSQYSARPPSHRSGVSGGQSSHGHSKRSRRSDRRRPEQDEYDEY